MLPIGPWLNDLTLLAAAGAEPPLGFDLTNLLAVLLAAWGAGWVATRVGYPAVLGELLAGILLGPPLLGLLDGGAGLKVIGNLGVVLMMLYIGTEVDPADLRRASVPGLLAAAGGFLVPAVLGFGVVLAFGESILAALFTAIAVGVTSLATKSRILVDLDLLDTRIAYVLMAGALLSDTATLVIFAAIVGFVELGGFDLAGTVLVAGEAAAFFVLVGFLGLAVLPRIGRWMERQGLEDRTSYFVVVVATGLGFAQLAELAGLHAVLGAFLAGTFLRRHVLDGRVGRQVNRVVRDLSIGLLAPVFFVTAGFEVTFGVFATDLALLVAILLVAMVGKIVGTGLFYLPTGHGWREGLTVGAAMNGRGAVEIIVAGIGLELGLISPELFTILVFMAIATTATVPVLLKLGVEWLHRRGELARTSDRRTGVLVVGAGPVARTFAAHLDGGRRAVLVDSNPELCAQARRQGLAAVNGDALDADVLRRARAGDAGLLLALTPNPEVNLLAAQLAHHQFAVPAARVALPHPPTRAMADLLERSSARPLLEGPVDLGRWDRWVAAGWAHPTTVTVAEGTDTVRLHDGLTRGRRGLPLTVARNGHHVPFVLVDQLQEGDEIIVLSHISAAQPVPAPW